MFNDLGLPHPPPNLPDHFPVMRKIISENINNRLPAECVEVGSWVGRSALLLSEYFYRVYCVDTFDGRTAKDWIGNTVYSQEEIFGTFLCNTKSRLMTTIVPCVGTSEFWAFRFSRKVEMVFIDGDHSYEGCKADITAWTPHVRPGGLMMWHDYGWHEGVTRAVDELFPNRITEEATIAWVKL